jgi:aspartyl-tRNA(Asn)/glutamyl-tRNA(Gln) amidotransferase subunit A
VDLTELTLTQASQAVSRRELSPAALTEAYLERIQAENPRLNAYITVTAQEARESAAAAEQALKSSRTVDPLLGMPLALKDLYDTAGILTTAGSSFLAKHLPESDAAVVEKLRAQGAVLLGKLNMHEIALGVTNVNPHYGPVRNPWNPERVSGGSSGGSGAALAARLCLGSYGSDTGGSIRIPAALCGIVGLKPTYGRISLRGVAPLSWNLDHPGPMARTVEDTALLLQAAAGYDPRDPASRNVPVDDYSTNLDGFVRRGLKLRVAAAVGDYFSACEPEVLQMVEQAAQTFRDLGAQVFPVEIPHIRQAAQVNGLMVICDAAAIHRERLEQNPDGFGEDVLLRLHRGQEVTAAAYIEARRAQAVLRREFENLFQEVDLLLTPTTPVIAPHIVGPDAVEQAQRLTRFTAPFNLTGLPAVSVPCGFTSEGLPVGLQLVARHWNEALLLQAAYAYQESHVR